MVRVTLRGHAVLALSLVFGVLPAVRGEDVRRPTPAPSTSDAVSKIYSLSEFSADPNLGTWIVRTLPEMVQPASWKQGGGAGLLSYYPQGNVLVVYHQPTIQAEVAAFLTNLKKALPQETAGKFATTPAVPAPTGVIPANYQSNLQRPPQVASHAAAAQPAVPAPPSVSILSGRQPKHLFHIILDGLEVTASEEAPQNMKLKNFTIRYEGDGIIDANIASLIKSLNQHAGALGQSAPGCSGGVCPLPGGLFRAVPVPTPMPLIPKTSEEQSQPEERPSSQPSTQPRPSSLSGPSNSTTPNVDAPRSVPGSTDAPLTTPATPPLPSASPQTAPMPELLPEPRKVPAVPIGTQPSGTQPSAIPTPPPFPSLNPVPTVPPTPNPPPAPPAGVQAPSAPLVPMIVIPNPVPFFPAPSTTVPGTVNGPETLHYPRPFELTPLPRPARY